jgi:hypothetical protein
MKDKEKNLQVQWDDVPIDSFLNILSFLPLDNLKDLRVTYGGFNELVREFISSKFNNIRINYKAHLQIPEYYKYFYKILIRQDQCDDFTKKIKAYNLPYSPDMVIKYYIDSDKSLQNFSNINKICKYQIDVNVKIENYLLIGRILKFLQNSMDSDLIESVNLRIAGVHYYGTISHIVSKYHIKFIADLLKNDNCKIRKLDLYNNSMTYEGISCLMEALELNKSVRNLNFTYNSINENIIEQFAEIYKNKYIEIDFGSKNHEKYFKSLQQNSQISK